MGYLGRCIGDAAIQAGHGGVHIAFDKSQIAEALRRELRPGDMVLLKASRALEFETLLDELKEPE